MADAEFAIRVRGLCNAFGSTVIHDRLDLDVRRGEILAIVGGSGTGKSVLLRALLGLKPPEGGRIELLGVDVARREETAEGRDLGRRVGVLFQDGALFNALTVAENVAVPLREHTGLSVARARDIALLKLAMVGLPPDAADKVPVDLSGGMRKRAGLARALALDPDILFLDEPTAGLDPIGAEAFDRLIADLRQSLGLTVVMVTHDLDSLFAICDRIAVLAERRVFLIGPMAMMLESDYPWLRAYFHGPRGRAARPA
ncbi:MAG: ABC transporter ATP-binding protein [Alphaproteobacteria bacterium]|nr:ABC transporter ATP-binding protein [Alphaproteobacteria bacterium]